MKYRLISGRTIDQAKGMHVGKRSDFYRAAVSTVEMNEQDMKDSALRDGDLVRIASRWGEAEGRARIADLPRGMAFIPMGPVANALSGTDTEGTGMPLFKGFTVEIDRHERQD